MHIRDWELITEPHNMSVAALRWQQSFFDEACDRGELLSEQQVIESFYDRAAELERHPVWLFRRYSWWTWNWHREYTHFWHQDLNENKRRLYAMRGSVYVGPDENHRNACIGWEISIPTPFWQLKLELGGEDHVQVSIAFGVVALWLRFTNIFPKQWWRKLFGDRWHWQSRNTGIEFHNGGIWLEWIHGGHDDELGKAVAVFPADILFGRTQYSSRVLRQETASIAFPEGDYDAFVEIFESTWKRPRLLWAKTIVRSTVEVVDGVPIPGNPEKDWYDGDDASYSLTSPASTVAEAINAFQQNINESRQRFGDKDWIEKLVNERNSEVVR